MLFLRAIKKNIYFLFITLAVLLFSCRFWEPMPLIAALPAQGFIDYTEKVVPFLLVLPVSFLLYDQYEIELGLTCGVRTTRLLFGKFCAVVLGAAIPSVLMVILYKYAEYIPQNGEKIRIPIYIPENFKWYMLVSALVTVLFFASLLLFIRVVTRNCYVPVGLGILAYTIADSLNKRIHSGSEDIRHCLYDPFLSNYFMGDTVLTEYYRVGPLWTYNRLLFFGIAVVLLIATYFLLRREKLHQGFND